MKKVKEVKLVREEKSGQEPILPGHLLMIIEPHIDRFTKNFINNFIQGWTKEDPQNGAKAAGVLLYKAIHDTRINYEGCLKKIFGDIDKNHPSFESKNELDVLSQHCTGKIVDSDPIYESCAKISNLSKSDLKEKIGIYMKQKTNSLLFNEYPNLYKFVSAELSGKKETQARNI